MRQKLSSRLRFTAYRRGQRLGRASEDKGGLPGAPEKRPLHRSLWVLYRELYRCLIGDRATVGLALLLLSIATLFRLVPPAATKLVIDNVLMGKPLPALLASWVPESASPRTRLILLVVTVFVISAVGTAIGLLSRWYATRTTKRVQVAARRRVFEHAARLPLHRVYELKTGGVSSLLREDAGGVGELVFSMIYNPWRAIVQLLGGLVVLAWVDARFLAIALLLAPAVYLSNLLWHKRLRPIYRDVRSRRQDIDATATEAFGGMRIVRAFGRQRTEVLRFVTEGHLMARQELYAWWWTRAVELAWDLLLPAASGLLLLYGGLSVLEGRLSLGELMMFLVYLAMLIEPIVVLASSFTQLQANLSGFDRVLDVLEEPTEMAPRPGARRVTKRGVGGRLRMENVSFHYPGSPTLVLRNISLDVEPGEVIALVGRSGSGKTTLCNLLARFYDPTDGAISLDGVDLREIEVDSYRRLWGIVEQDVFLFDGTIMENIAYADKRATRGDVEAAARVANAAEFIAAFPEGYDTRIGERGVRLSGGQRQRLAIARAVLADPKIFLLDEATSNLDSHSEALIQRALGMLLRGRTSFVIAHRLSTIRQADRILVLDAGAVIECGSHDELIAKGGAYSEMVELQSLERGDRAVLDEV
jgi:ATP-binding cassette subfamily B protein/subfamily B ATP-binding cassette protein MsbA